MAFSIMPNFKTYKILVIICILLVIVVSVRMMTNINPKVKRIYQSGNVIGVVVGNSHANRIMLNDDRIFYMNEDGNSILGSMKQIEYAIKEFKDLKFIIVNLTPMEMFAENFQKSSENDSLYKTMPNEYFKFFEKNISISQVDFIKKIKYIFKNFIDRNSNGHPFYLEGEFYKNGRKVIPSEIHRPNMEWLQLSHYRDGVFIPEYEEYGINLKRIESIVKEFIHIKIIAISMPLNYRYMNHLNNVLDDKELPNIDYFAKDMETIFGACYINLMNNSLPDKYFWDGDHLNQDGAEYMKETIVKRINECLHFQYNVH
ncbi:hypothetical protein [Shewanella dokdonensis]|uniref:SGNH/GDSL hydrolase family protein n=1 Tax=Shewanella dokdonensis TaxID=712036 RepID=A0ABX8DDJ4_9GAMM|nr:hypothetical protein [Shewanella dokdonensis]MCL1073371.1 hypothetical protein [Shewanella dokdonensis]QVK22809.1 hypothetical protein KHX94_16605 [Shewanella dokdonensis]